jgi:hypothetical protein
MILEATTTERRVSGSGSDPGSGRRLSPTVSRTGSGKAVGPQVQTYQTHIFAPPVTGAPIKKTKFSQSESGTIPRENGGSVTASGASVGPGNFRFPCPLLWTYDFFFNSRHTQWTLTNGPYVDAATVPCY